MGTTSSSSADDSCIEDYKFLSRLGYGGFGDVFKCVDKRTKKIVALKVSNRPWGLVREASMLKKLMDHKLDQCNIVKFYNSFGTDRCLVFEPLDISLKGHLAETKVVMQLQDIRTVIEQMAEALDALKKIGVIHSDVNTNNIMLMDRVRPFRVKLIDFGMAISTCSAEQSHIDHGYSNR
ncbi:homeodomain-interacting protein kinase 1-like [Scomber scombrus]|uniref:Homeodomain-interacting protein kinase 1-like n=2 Tax=Scomber scombrus TaxID=13677 RepID=A0AAV1N206_SCOSC